MNHRYRYVPLGLLAIVLLTPLAAHTIPQDDQAAVILVYHRIGDPRHPTTQIDTERFARHVRLLAEGDYHVLDLAEIVDAWRAGRSLPERSVAITIDDAYASFFDHGWPILRRHRLPFTLFVSTDAVDGGYADYMNWDQIRALAQSGLGRIGNHSATHRSLPRQHPSAKAADILRAHRRLSEETGITPTLYSYPYGEFDAESRDILQDHGYQAAFGQYSSVASAQGDRFYIPRFPINQRYGDPDRIRRITTALPLPMRVITGIVDHQRIDPSRTIRLRQEPKIDSPTTCYAGPDTAPRHAEDGAIEIHLPPAEAPPTSLNCTAPEKTAAGTRWRWWGRSLLCCAP